MISDIANHRHQQVENPGEQSSTRRYSEHNNNLHIPSAEWQARRDKLWPQTQKYACMDKVQARKGTHDKKIWLPR